MPNRGKSNFGTMDDFLSGDVFKENLPETPHHISMATDIPGMNKRDKIENIEEFDPIHPVNKGFVIEEKSIIGGFKKIFQKVPKTPSVPKPTPKVTAADPSRIHVGGERGPQSSLFQQEKPTNVTAKVNYVDPGKVRVSGDKGQQPSWFQETKPKPPTPEVPKPKQTTEPIKPTDAMEPERPKVKPGKVMGGAALVGSGAVGTKIIEDQFGSQVKVASISGEDIMGKGMGKDAVKYGSLLAGGFVASDLANRLQTKREEKEKKKREREAETEIKGVFKNIVEDGVDLSKLVKVGKKGKVLNKLNNNLTGKEE